MRLRIILLALSGLLLFTGCLGNDPNIVASVGNASITGATLQERAETYSQLSGGEVDVTAAKTAVLNWAIASMIINQSKNTIITEMVTDEAKSEAIAGVQILAILDADPKTKEWAKELSGFAIAANYLDQETFLTIAQEVGVVVNPRYGKWDVMKAQVTGDGSLSVPFAGVE